MSTALVHSLLQQIAALSESEQAELRAGLNQQLAANGQGTNGQAALQLDPQDAAALRWLNEHRTEHINEWVALEGDRLLAHGSDLRVVAQQARATGVAYPLLHFIEPEREHPYIRS